MSKLDLKAIIAKHELDARQIAAALFPGNMHPMPALNRVLNGDAYLDSEQLSKLADISNLTINDLYCNSQWDTLPVPSGDNVYAFRSGKYIAELNRDTWITKLSYEGSLFHESIIVKGTSLTLSEYFNELEKIIIKHIKNG